MAQNTPDIKVRVRSMPVHYPASGCRECARFIDYGGYLVDISFRGGRSYESDSTFCNDHEAEAEARAEFLLTMSADV